MKSLEERREYHRMWRKTRGPSLKSKESKKAYDKKRNQDPKRIENRNLNARKRWNMDREKNNAYQKEVRIKVRMLVLNHYSDGKMECMCCGENHYEFLCIDHINGCGLAHRKSIGGGGSFYRWLKKNNFPIGFRVLCHNCNLALGFYGFCPHTLIK